MNRTPQNFNWDDFNLDEIKPFLRNSLFEGIVGKKEFLILNETSKTLKENKKKTVVISIHDPDSDNHNPKDLEGYKDFLELKFWDIEEEVGNYKPITEEQGKELFNFIQKNKDSKFLVHCHAGMSRSAGVACAIECIVNHDCNVYEYKTSHSDVKSFPRYHVNWTVFDKIVK